MGPRPNANSACGVGGLIRFKNFQRDTLNLKHEKTMNQKIDKTLKMGLLGNAMFSGSAALGMFLAAKPIASALGLPDFRLIVATGILLIPFALHLISASRRSAVSRGEILYLSAMDGLRVLGSGALLATDVLPISTAGIWLVAGVAVIVADLMALQIIGLLRHERTLAFHRMDHSSATN